MLDKPTIESRLEQGLFASRWLMAPMYLGLSLSLAMLVVGFVKELLHDLPLVVFMSIGRGDAAYSASPETMQWMVVVHLTFVASGVLLALMEWPTSKASEQ